jgi:hypothetical protein
VALLKDIFDAPSLLAVPGKQYDKVKQKNCSSWHDVTHDPGWSVNAHFSEVLFSDASSGYRKRLPLIPLMEAVGMVIGYSSCALVPQLANLCRQATPRTAQCNFFSYGNVIAHP